MDYLLGLFSSSTIFQVRARWITSFILCLSYLFIMTAYFIHTYHMLTLLNILPPSSSMATYPFCSACGRLRPPLRHCAQLSVLCTSALSRAHLGSPHRMYSGFVKFCCSHINPLDRCPVESFRAIPLDTNPVKNPVYHANGPLDLPGHGPPTTHQGPVGSWAAVVRLSS
jgi:hypothetical protein